MNSILTYALCLVVPLHAAAWARQFDTRAVTPKERHTFVSEHNSIRQRLIQVGLDAVRRQKDEPTCSALAFMMPKIKTEAVWVADGALVAIFQRGRGTLLHVLYCSRKNIQDGEAQEETQRTFSAQAARLRKLACAYVKAIEGVEPDGEGGLEVESLRRSKEVPASHRVYAKWPRTYRGYRFRDDSTQLVMTQVDGALVSYAKRFYSRTPPSLHVKVRSGDALAAAREAAAHEIRRKATFDPKTVRLGQGDGTVFTSRDEYVKELESLREELRQEAAHFSRFIGMESSSGPPPRLLIVNPNSCYTDQYPGRHDLRWNSETRLVWVVVLHYEARTTVRLPERVLHMEVWVDAATGEVVGGGLPY